MTRLTYVALFALTGCFIVDDGAPGHACTMMGCEDGLAIAFSLTQPGMYDFEIIADTRLITCTAVLPLAPCGTPSAQCSDPRVAIGESGCALAAADQSLEGLSFMGTLPESVTVVVQRDGAEIASQVFNPSYQRLAPNGEECGPVCHHAGETLVLSE